MTTIMYLASFMAPGLPSAAEKPLLSDLAYTYGKTWVTWQFDKDALPLGIPQLMMVQVDEGKWNPELFQRRENRYTFYNTEKYFVCLSTIDLLCAERRSAEKICQFQKLKEEQIIGRNRHPFS